MQEKVQEPIAGLINPDGPENEAIQRRKSIASANAAREEEKARLVAEAAEKDRAATLQRAE